MIKKATERRRNLRQKRNSRRIKTQKNGKCSFPMFCKRSFFFAFVIIKRSIKIAHYLAPLFFAPSVCDSFCPPENAPCALNSKFKSLCINNPAGEGKHTGQSWSLPTDIAECEMLVMAIHGFLAPSSSQRDTAFEAHQTEDGIFSLCFTKHHTFFFCLSRSSFNDQQNSRNVEFARVVNFGTKYLHNPSISSQSECFFWNISLSWKQELNRCCFFFRSRCSKQICEKSFFSSTLKYFAVFAFSVLVNVGYILVFAIRMFVCTITKAKDANWIIKSASFCRFLQSNFDDEHDDKVKRWKHTDTSLVTFEMALDTLQSPINLSCSWCLWGKYERKCHSGNNERHLFLICNGWLFSKHRALLKMRKRIMTKHSFAWNENVHQSCTCIWCSSLK